MVPSVAAPQDILKVFFKGEFEKPRKDCMVGKLHILKHLVLILSIVNTGYNMKWYHFEILAGGKTSKHCLIKREPTLAYIIGQKLWQKVGNPVGVYTILTIFLPSHFMSPPPPASLPQYQC